jgi:hypothetical protein
MDRKYTGVAQAIRRIVEHWSITRTDLIMDANSGDTVLNVKSTRRFRVGDQLLIHNDAEDMENNHYIYAINGKTQLILTAPLKWPWPMYTGAHVVKTQGGQFVKAVYLGEPNVMTDLPAITVMPQSASSEFYTLRGTKERYDFEIGVYVNASTMEEGDLLLWDLVDTIQAGLKQNFYPLLNDYETTTLLQDVNHNDIFIRVADSSIFTPQQELIIEDQYNIDVFGVIAICDATTIQLGAPSSYDFLAADATVIRPNRLPFNSWPTGVKFGLINKGTLLKAASISYFVEEYEYHDEAGFGDPQLS